MKDKLMPYLLLAPQILLTILFMIGLVTGITQSLGVIPAFGLKKPTLFYYKEVLSRPDMIRSVLYSLRIALLSSTLATAGGVFFCGVCIMGKKTQGAVMRIIQLPIIVPHVVAALFIINIFSRNGILARAAYALGMIQEQQQFPMLIYDSHGLGIIMAYLWKEIPFIIYFIIALMANINGSLGEAATNLGAKTWTVFWRVTLPLCRNTIISGFLIIFVFSLGAYELPLLLGATVPKALPVLAYHEYIHPDLRHRPYAMALNGIIIIISLISALLYFLMIRKNVKCLTEEQ
ncbi:MAG: ABC transporter permease subunit [Hungatella sp.]|jgi:putative spermidine/putrescine transport system permease protein|nr:ABC transporter permease subunit [Hungatella sp.]